MYSLTLQNAAGDSVITSGDILGRINFAVPAESDGFSATYISSFINCSADGVFTSGSNPAGLIFGVSSADPNAATGVLKISSDGHFMPLASGTYDLGSSSYPFRNLYIDNGYIVAASGYFDVISFNVDNESILTKGQISWDDTEGTMDIGLTDNTTIHIGEHRYFRIRNQTGDTLYKGQVVYATGVHSNGLITPAKYVADGTVREVRFMGLVLENVNHNNNGYVIDFGHLENIDLDGSATNYAVGDETWVAGDILYVHPTVAGKLTKNQPKHSISVAIILNPGDGNGNGQMFVRPTSYGHLDDNHDVAISGATNGQFLQYNSVTDYWVPSSSGNFTTLQVNGTLVPTGVGTSNYVTKWTGANSLDSGIIYDNGTNVGIGTSSPSSKLDVSGVITATGGNSTNWNTSYSWGDHSSVGYLTDISSQNIQDLNNVISDFSYPLLVHENILVYDSGISAFKGSTLNLGLIRQGSVPLSGYSNSYLGYYIRMNSSEFTVNEQGTNLDFRVEGDTDTNLLFTDASTDRVGISTSVPDVRLQLNESVVDDNTYVYDTNACMIVHPTGTSTTSLNDPKEIFYLARQGTTGQAYGAAAAFSLSRYENSSTNSRTRLDIDLADGTFLNSKTKVLTMLSNGNVGIGESSPSSRLDVEGGDVVFNDNGGNFDFRVEGDTDPNLLFVDASVDDVGIGTNSPTEKLDVNGSIKTRTGGVGHEDQGCYVAYPGGGTFSTGTATNTGYLKITLPVSWTATMLAFDIDIYEYTTRKIKKFRVGGYNFTGSNWVNVSALMDSDNDFAKYKVHFGHDGTKCAVYISEIDSNNADLGSSTTWNYCKVSLSNLFAGHSNNTMANWADGWSISFTTTLGTITGGAIEVSRPYRQHDTSYVFNEYGGNVDFRVEGDTDANLLFTDASADRIGIGTNTPLAKLHNDGSDTIPFDRIYEKDFYFNFTNGVANQKADLIFDNSSSGITGYVEIELTAGWANQNAGGKIKKVIGFLAGSGGVIYVNEGSYTEVIGYTSINFAISDLIWDSTISKYIIKIVHRVSTGNEVNVKLRVIPVNDTVFARVVPVSSSAIYTTDTTSYDQPYVSFSDRVGIGTSSPSARLNVEGGDVIFNDLGGNYDFRVEGDTDENLISVDASTDRVGIGILVPQAKLDVNGSFRADDVVTLGSGSIPLPRKPIELLNPTNIAELTINESYTFPTTDGTSGQALITDGAGSVSWTNIALNQTVNGRLTLESGVPISTTGQTAKTTLYFTPYLGNQIALYNGTEWKIYSFSELSLSLSGYTANTNYDIFIYDNSGTLTLESTAWTNNTARATSLVTQDGVYVKDGATTRRYLGTIRITATTGQCEDSASRRFVWNLYNQVEKLLTLNYYPGAPHTYTTSAWRSWNNTTVVGNTRLELLRGLNLSPLETKVWCEMINGWSSIAVDSTSVPNSYIKANSGSTGAADSFNKFLTVSEGYHYLQTLQYGTTGSTFYSLFVQSSFLG